MIVKGFVTQHWNRKTIDRCNASPVVEISVTGEEAGGAGKRKGKKKNDVAKEGAFFTLKGNPEGRDQSYVHTVPTRRGPFPGVRPIRSPGGS